MSRVAVFLFAQLIAWRWSGDAPHFGKSFYQAPRTTASGPVTCTFTLDKTATTARTACVAGGHELWHVDESHAFVNDAALVIDGTTLYSARYSDISTGCTLHAFDLTTGRERWVVRLEGLGPIGHSEYLNSVQIRVMSGRPVVFGWESSGRYIESRDPTTGASTFHQLLP
jgi:outer membrane protein assembly factor BamB